MACRWGRLVYNYMPGPHFAASVCWGQHALPWLRVVNKPGSHTRTLVVRIQTCPYAHTRSLTLTHSQTGH